MLDDKDLSVRASVTQMVDAYKQAGVMVAQAYTLLDDAKKLLESAFGKHYQDFSTMPDPHDRCYYAAPSVAEGVMAKIKKNAWKCIVNRLGIRKIMSIKAAEELDKKLEEAKQMPELETATVFATLQMLVQNADDYMQKAILEVYDLLRPAKSATRWEHIYKTNQKNGKFALGKKVILTWYVEGSYSRQHPLRVNYRREQELCAIDKVFHALDGAGVPDGYKSELVDAINTSPDGRGQTDYFKFQAYGNRNLHLTFRRLDLVQKLNQLAGTGPELRD